MKLSFEKDVLAEYAKLQQRKVELSGRVTGLNESLVTIKTISADLEAEIEREIAEAAEKLSSLKDEVAGLESSADHLSEALADEVDTAWALRERRHAWFAKFAADNNDILLEVDNDRRSRLLQADEDECRRWAVEYRRQAVVDNINAALDEINTSEIESADEFFHPLVDMAVELGIGKSSSTWQRLSRKFSPFFRELSPELQNKVKAFQAKPKNGVMAKELKKVKER